VLKVSVTASPESSRESTTEKGSYYPSETVSTRGLDGSHPGNIPPSHGSEPHTVRFYGMWSELVSLSEILVARYLMPSKDPNAHPERQCSSSKHAVHPLLPLGRDGRHGTPEAQRAINCHFVASSWQRRRPDFDQPQSDVVVRPPRLESSIFGQLSMPYESKSTHD
jgi:hypothetical protein